MKNHIMIAEDNDIIRMLLEEYLKEDFEVKAFADGSEILKYLNNGNIPNLILADINMPNLDGWELIKNLKQSLFFKNIPVIILSGIEKSQEKIKFLKAGAEDYMVKPFNPEELKLKIHTILKRINYGINY